MVGPCFSAVCHSFFFCQKYRGCNRKLFPRIKKRKTSSHLAARCKQAGGVSSSPCLPLPFRRNGKATSCLITDTDGEISLLGCAKLPARSQVSTEIWDCSCCCSGSLPTISHFFLFVLFWFSPTFFPLLFSHSFSLPFFLPLSLLLSFTLFFYLFLSFSFSPAGRFYLPWAAVVWLEQGPAQYLPPISNTSGDPRGFSCLNQCLRMGWEDLPQLRAGWDFSIHPMGNILAHSRHGSRSCRNQRMWRNIK